MIVSFKHNFVFVKTRKTGGTSMEIALCSHAGPDDIVTPLAAGDEYVRHAHFPDGLPRNYSDNPEAEEAFRAAVRRHDRAALINMKKDELKKIQFHNHTSAQVARSRLGEAFWNDAFKFTIERHPYEKAVSQAYMKAARGGDFGSILDEEVNRGAYKNFHLYSENGTLLVDYVIRYEALTEGLRHAGGKIGLADLPGRFPLTKHAYRRDDRPALEILNPRQKLAIQEHCKAEFEFYGYEP